MNFSQVACFVALADLQNFTEAAYSVNLTQSAVSHALASLESELGVTLLDRNRKGHITLSVAGKKVLPHARALLDNVLAIQQESKAVQGQIAGKVRLGNGVSLRPDLLARVLRKFEQQYPEMEVVLFEGTMQEVSEWLAESVVDVGFVLHPAKGFESVSVSSEELYVVMPAGHRLSQWEAVPPTELREEGFIMVKTGCAYQLMDLAGLEGARPPIRYQASDTATVLSMVREGLGITILPGTMLPRRLAGVVALPLSPARQMHFGLAVRSQKTASVGARLFIKTVLEEVQEPELVLV